MSTGPARSPNEYSQIRASGARKKPSSQKARGRRKVQKTTGCSRQLSMSPADYAPAGDDRRPGSSGGENAGQRILVKRLHLLPLVDVDLAALEHLARRVECRVSAVRFRN